MNRIARRVGLALAALPAVAAAAPRQQLSLAVPMTDGTFFATPSNSGSASRYQPAPTPNRDVSGPAGPRSTGPSLAPTLFTSKPQYRGDGFSPGSTAQGEQERNLRPGAGLLLHMPLTPQ